jgi:Transposase
LQADHFHTVKNIWGHLKKALLSYRRKIKVGGEAKNDQECIELAKTLWQLRWSLLKQPINLSAGEKQAIAELEREDKGFVRSFRSIIRQLVHSFDHSHSDAQGKISLQQLRKDIRIQIYQAIKYLSLDIAEFVEKGPQMTGPPRV